MFGEVVATIVVERVGVPIPAAAAYRRCRAVLQRGAIPPALRRPKRILGDPLD